ncbi:hypothetical protein HMPREF9089_01361 [Eubacterium brachy ATCC 33089]|nr:hypothetical protein HMPREF9089_01361 [Eubacterium brachy ATCC 33089]
MERYWSAKYLRKGDGIIWRPYGTCYGSIIQTTRYENFTKRDWLSGVDE